MGTIKIGIFCVMCWSSLLFGAESKPKTYTGVGVRVSPIDTYIHSHNSTGDSKEAENARLLETPAQPSPRPGCCTRVTRWIQNDEHEIPRCCCSCAIASFTTALCMAVCKMSFKKDN